MEKDNKIEVAETKVVAPPKEESKNEVVEVEIVEEPVKPPKKDDTNDLDTISDDELYTKREQNRLNRNNEMLDDVIGMVYDDVKDTKKKGGDVSRGARLLRELTETSSNSTHKQAEIRTKNKTANAQGDMASATAALLTELHRASEAKTPAPAAQRELPALPTDQLDLVAGETSTEKEEFIIEDYTGKNGE